MGRENFFDGWKFLVKSALEAEHFGVGNSLDGDDAMIFLVLCLQVDSSGETVRVGVSDTV
jgi:hypothetical protein